MHFRELLPLVKGLLEFELKLQNHSLTHLSFDLLFDLVVQRIVLRGSLYLLDLKYSGRVLLV